MRRRAALSGGVKEGSCPFLTHCASRSFISFAFSHGEELWRDFFAGGCTVAVEDVSRGLVTLVAGVESGAAASAVVVVVMVFVVVVVMVVPSARLVFVVFVVTLVGLAFGMIRTLVE
jgi:hypothetical protein